MASKANQLAQLHRALGAVRLVFQGVHAKHVHEVYNKASGYLVPGYSGTTAHALPIGVLTHLEHVVTLTGQFSADVERHDVLWEMLERMPQVSCLVVYTDLPDHSFNFGPREL